MSDPSTKILIALVRQLLAIDAALGNPDGADDSRAFRACDRLRSPLSKLIGIGGFRSLLSRALALAGEDVPWLRGLHINADGSVEGLETEVDPREFNKGELALMTEFVGLLVAFIGPALTLQFLLDICPTIPDTNL